MANEASAPVPAWIDGPFERVLQPGKAADNTTRCQYQCSVRKTIITHYHVEMGTAASPIPLLPVANSAAQICVCSHPLNPNPH